MHRYIAAIVFVIAALAAASRSHAAPPTLGLAGTWDWEAAKSHGTPPLPASVTVTFTRDDGAGLSWREKVVRADGSSNGFEAAADFGGKATPIAALQGTTVTLTRTGPAGFLVRYTYPDGSFSAENCTVGAGELTCHGTDYGGSRDGRTSLNVFRRR